MASPEVKPLSISCTCGQITGHAAVASSKLPLPLTLCHCDTCRHVSGLLCITWVELPQGTTTHLQGGTKSYQSSSDCTRSFCSTCGSHISYNDRRNDPTAICSGVLVEIDGLIGSVKDHIFVADTRDGGMSVWLRDATQWAERSSGHKWCSSESFSALQPPPVSAGEKLQAKCHCGGVNFYITRPNIQSEDLDSPLPDLLVPYDGLSSDNPDDVEWWIRARGTKYLAGTCACKSCRLASGSDIQTWAFVPKSNILQADGRPLDFSMGKLKRYESSEGCYRDFCGTCGATVFWSSNQRPKLVDVSVGLFRSHSGARAEDWLEWWTERVSFEQDAPNKSFISDLRAGLESWASCRSA